MKITPDHCIHLTAEIVLEIHAAVIKQFGGSAGVSEMALLESAVAAPQASWGGKSPYADIVEVAAAYLFFLCKNHPFLDGNKRQTHSSPKRYFAGLDSPSARFDAGGGLKD